MTDYERIEKAIVFLKQNFKQQPDLDEVAKQVHLSPFHFQRLFKEWAGVSPKKFVQFLSVEYAKDLLKQNLSLLDTSFETGLSGTGRLHDLFINVEGMTPGEYKNGGQDLQIQYSFAETIFGDGPWGRRLTDFPPRVAVAFLWPLALMTPRGRYLLWRRWR